MSTLMGEMTADDAVKLQENMAITAVTRHRMGFITHLMYYVLISRDLSMLSRVNGKRNAYVRFVALFRPASGFTRSGGHDAGPGDLCPGERRRRPKERR
jgi:hypothetical protein